MAVRDHAELLAEIGAMFGEDVSDEKLKMLEDISDTLADATAPDPDDWKGKYEELDKTWRQRYRDRFMGVQADPKVKVEVELEPPDPEPPKPKTYEELFEEEVK